MRYIECPEIYKGNEKSLFLAGGISNCYNWQSALIKSLHDTNLTILNPRRKFFPTGRIDIAKEQIEWEYNHLSKTSAVSFWFPPETLCPITLFELGKQSIDKKPLFIGVDPNYQRKVDVKIQIGLIRPNIKIVYSLENLTEQIKIWSKK